MRSIHLPTIRRQLASLQPGGRTTLADAHTRLDVVELQIEALTSAVEQAATGQANLARSVEELTASVAMLKQITGSTQDSLKTFVADTKEGREMLAKMIAEVIERKTGSWAMWLMLAAITTASNWLPRVWEIFRAGIAVHG